MRTMRTKKAPKVTLKKNPKSMRTSVPVFDESTPIVKTLNRHDVLMGRGNLIGQIGGNVHFRRVCWQYKDDYIRGMREIKPMIAQGVLDHLAMLSPPGHVVAKTEAGLYRVVSHARAIEKVQQQLREKGNKQPSDLILPKKKKEEKPKSTKPRRGAKKEAMQIIKVQAKGGARKSRQKVKSVKVPKGIEGETMLKAIVKAKPAATKARKTVSKRKPINKAIKLPIQMPIRHPIKVPRFRPETQLRPHAFKVHKTEVKSTPIINKGTRRSLRLLMTKSIDEAYEFPSIQHEPTVIGSHHPPPVTPETEPLGEVKQASNMMGCVLPAITSPEEQSPLPPPPSTDFLRGYSSLMPLPYVGGEQMHLAVVETSPVMTFSDEAEEQWDMEVEGITPPPPFTRLESGVLSSWSHFGEVSVESAERGSPAGVVDMTLVVPTMLKPMNSLFSSDIYEADAFMSTDMMEHVFSPGTQVKRALF